VLNLIGLGLFDEKDISLRGLEVLKSSDKVYAEFYTNYFGADLKRLEELAGKPVTVLSRADVEERPEATVLKHAKSKNVSFLVSGDPLVATTHADIAGRAKALGVEVGVVHSSSVISAVAECGLQAYKFGKTTTLPFPQPNYEPTSPYEAIRGNQSLGLHTLVLLDVKATEGRYMSVGEGIDVLHSLEAKLSQKVFTEDTQIIGMARLGAPDRVIKAGKAEDLKKTDFGGPPHVLVVPGKMHFMEEEALSQYSG